MNTFLFERACGVGLIALLVASSAQLGLEGRVPAAWRVWVWRVALLQTALALVPMAPLRLAVLPPRRIAVLPGISPIVSAIEAPIHSPVRVADNPVSAPHEMENSIVASARRESARRESNSASDSAPDSAAPFSIAPRFAIPSAKSVAAPILPLKAANPWAPPEFWPLAMGIYALGLAVQLVALTRSFLSVRRLLRRCVPMEDREIAAALCHIAWKMEVGAWPRLLAREAGAPFLVGVFRPAIVLPRELMEPRGPDLDAILHHELAHLKRRDLTWNLILWPIQAMFWFHPLVWASRFFLPLETESACDEMVLASTRITPRCYGALLLNTMNCEPSPLTAGVSDGLSTFKTRLKRLNRAPKRPRRAAKIAFVAALSTALMALVPLRLVTRAVAQVETATPSVSVSQAAPKSAATASTSLSGTVRDQKGNPVAGATVYAMNFEKKRNEPLEITTSDARGHFQFSSQVRVENDEFSGEFSAFADAGARGLGDAAVPIGTPGQNLPLEIRVAPTVNAALRFLDPQGRPTAGLAVHIAGIIPPPAVRPNLVREPLRKGNSDTLMESLLAHAHQWERPRRRGWMAIPRPLLPRLTAQTDARGVAHFRGLPRGSDARFWAGEQRPASTWNGPILVRGVRYAPLRLESALDLFGRDIQRTIHLVKATGISGHITLPDGSTAFRAIVSAREIQGPDGVYHLSDRGSGIKPQALTDGAGNYQLEGLRPGRYLIQVFPSQAELNQFVGPISEMVIGSTRRVDFRLSRGVIVEGILVGQGTRAPVKGQVVDLHNTSNPHRRYYYTAATDARGHFRFHVGAGPQHLRLDSADSGHSNRPPSGFSMPAKREFDFSLPDGTKRQFQIEMPLAPPDRAVTGQVVGPNGKPQAGAKVFYRSVGGFDTRNRSVWSDAKGRFSIPAQVSKRPLQLFADWGELTTPQSTLALSGDVVRLQLQNNAWASLTGRVTDKQNQPIAGADVYFYANLGESFYANERVKTDSAGRYYFGHRRPGNGAMVQVRALHFGPMMQTVRLLKVGQTQRLDASLRPAPKTLRGQVLNEDGTPARDFRVAAEGLIDQIRTRPDGFFYLPQVMAGPLQVRVSKGFDNWKPFPARGGDQNLVIRLSTAGIDDSSQRFFSALKPNLLVGKTAPALRIARWGDGRAASLASLRGKVVVLAFGWFNVARNSDVEAFARAQSNAVQVVGIQGYAPRVRGFAQPIDIHVFAREMGFPVALDAPDKSGAPESDGQTHARYQGAKYVVIGRSGKVGYAGRDFDRAVLQAAWAAKNAD